MHTTHIENLDLNLLKVFVEVYKTGSVSKAAERLYMSQSACSHSLTRLRQRLNDELFVRHNNKMLPTLKANDLFESLDPALNLINQGIAKVQPFDAKVGLHEFVISATDYTMWCLLPKLTAYLDKHFPNIRLKINQTTEKIPYQDLLNNEVDFALGFDHKEEQLAGIASHTWLTDSYCTVCDAEYSKFNQLDCLDLESFLSHRHFLIAPWNEFRGVVDHTLAKQNQERKHALILPSVLAAPHVLKGTSLLLTLPKRYAAFLTTLLPLKMFKPPINVPDYQLKLYWHSTRNKDEKTCWFIKTIESLELS